MQRTVRDLSIKELELLGKTKRLKRRYRKTPMLTTKVPDKELICSPVWLGEQQAEVRGEPSPSSEKINTTILEFMRVLHITD